MYICNYVMHNALYAYKEVEEHYHLLHILYQLFCMLSLLPTMFMTGGGDTNRPPPTSAPNRCCKRHWHQRIIYRNTPCTAYGITILACMTWMTMVVNSLSSLIFSLFFSLSCSPFGFLSFSPRHINIVKIRTVLSSLIHLSLTGGASTGKDITINHSSQWLRWGNVCVYIPKICYIAQMCIAPAYPITTEAIKFGLVTFICLAETYMYL